MSMLTPFPSTVSSMFQLAEELLTAVVAAMATTDAGPPDTSYVTLGEPAWPALCSQAVVMVPTLGEGNTATSGGEGLGRRFEEGRVNLVGMVAYAMRCGNIVDGNLENLPEFQTLSPVEMTAIAKAGYEDGWAIWNYVTRALRKGILFSGECSIVHFDGSSAVAPEAGLAGWRFVCRVELAGYDPSGS